MSTAQRRGRRPGSPDTRAAILSAAREHFAAAGFGGTTIRAIAADAGVDAALVHHYFGSKDDLFVAALALPVDPRELLTTATLGPAEQAAEPLLRTFLSVWDDPGLQPGLLATVRRVLEPGGDKLIREGFLPVVIIPMGERLGVDRPDLRMPLVASQVIGLILARYVLRIEPIASLGTDELVGIYGPVVQRYLTGDLPVQ
ncbi:AcrR family transcriptional regulator [Nocardioides thalensis]|uniref:AcrR family transcriptional regulator n=1 Tax=Nocardioides thalensis TaxID=1914755 RepID=A0A853BUH0_9ACTN|nr:TetR family transcriptional regulator [Nocardioides thalensis]NYI99499.1 AcrR family transcriptional regulator [Nocardioides thalensis]